MADIATLQAVLASDPTPHAAEIVACEAALCAAQLAGDAAALDRLISDDLLFAGPDGQLATKAQDLDAHRSGVVRFRALEPEELRLRRVRDDVVIASLRARLVVEVAGTVHEGAFRYTRVWARDAGGEWRVAGGQVSGVSAGPASADAADTAPTS